jgi:hypothetical protein
MEEEVGPWFGSYRAEEDEMETLDLRCNYTYFGKKNSLEHYSSSGVCTTLYSSWRKAVA